MITTLTIETVYEQLAAIIDYPAVDYPVQVRDCAAALKARRSRAASHMARFGDFITGTAFSRIEELYTATFDLKPVCYPYIGFQLFGDTYKRGEFLAQLNARYREAGCVVQGDLPDHLGAMLRYLARTWDADLVTEGVIPALDRMIEQLKDNPFRDVMRAVRVFLQEH